MTGSSSTAGRPSVRVTGATLLLLAAGVLSARGADQPPGVRLLSETDGGVVLEVVVPEPLPDPEWIGAGTRLTLPGWGTDFSVGVPTLPRSRVRVALPPGVVPRLSVDVLESQVLHPGRPAVGFEVTPAPDPVDPVRTSGIVTRAARLRDDVDWPFPATVARLESEAMLRRVRLQPILLTPVRMIDGSGRVEVARRFRIRVTWDVAETRQTRLAIDEPDEEAFYRGAAINPGGVRRWRVADLRPATPRFDAGFDQTTRTPAVDAGEPTVNSVPVLRRALPLTPRPGSPVFRLGIREDGVVRLNATWLATNAPGLTAHPANTLFIASMGQERPLRVVDGGDGTISGSDYLEFFGEKLDEDPLDPDDWQAGDFSDERAYLLGASDGVRLRVSTAVSGAPVAGHPVTGSFVETTHFEVNTTFVNTMPDNFADRWYHHNFLNTGNPFRDFSVSTPGATTGTAAVRARLLGFLTPGGNPAGYHRTRLSIGATVLDQDDWDGLVEHTHGADTPATFNANLLSPTTVVRLTLPFDRVVNGVTYTQDAMFLNWIELDYPRLFSAAGNRLLFTVPNTAQRIIVSGLTGTAADASVWDVTPSGAGLAVPRHLSGATASGGSPFSLTFEINPGEVAGPIRRLAITAGAALAPAAVAVHTEAADLATGGADWLLIGHGPLLDTAPGSALSDLVARRQASGMATRVVTARAAYDQFSWGLQDPQALRDLIGWAVANWSPAPRYVLLVGDASYDYKNDYGHAVARNLLPTYMGSLAISPQLTYFAEDNRFAAVVGDDDLPDVMLGRLPAHSLAEAEGVFAKIDDYEALSPGPAWTRRAFFISDLESGGFESSMRSVISSHFDRPENPGVTDTVGPCFSDPAGTCHNNFAGPGPQFRTASFHALALRQPGVSFPTLAPTMESWIQDGVNGGAALTYFIGHGFYTSWGREASFFQTRWTTPADDVDSLLNGSTATVLFNLNCITGAFQIDSPVGTPASSDLIYSLGEDWVLTPGRGAVAAIAPSHLAFISVLGSTTSMLGGRWLGEERDRELGALNLSLRLHFDAIGSTTDLRSFSFIGDPATRLIMPDPEPPGVPTVVAGNSQVALSWSPGPDAVTFRVERAAQGPGGPYAGISPPGLSATQFTDTQVKNGSVYYYRLVGRDSDGMDSVPSNSNADCPGGPACAEAHPLNPLPPATPAGFTVIDPATGSRLDFAWLANPEPDVSHYRLRYGTAPDNLTTMLTLPGSFTGTTLNELTPGETLYFALEALNTSGLTSAPTPEVSATPLNVDGISPPATIDDLMVTRDGADTVLTWGAQGSDIYGRPLAVASYRVYSSSVSPLYPIDEAHRLTTVAASPTPNWRHVGAATAPPMRFYLVVARDGLGFDAGTGTGLPDGITDLQVDRLGGGMLRLTWPPVTTGGGGEPLAIDHYTLYASGAPFSRGAVTGMTPIRPVLGATIVDVQESEGAFFSVLSVDARGSLSPF